MSANTRTTDIGKRWQQLLQHTVLQANHSHTATQIVALPVRAPRTTLMGKGGITLKLVQQHSLHPMSGVTT